MFVRRSNLIIPVVRQDFVEKAWSRLSDAVTLDLEDSVPEKEKDLARKLLQNSVPIVARGISDVLVRVNNSPHLLELDLESAVSAGATGILLPKVESAEAVTHVARLISEFESGQNKPLGKVSLSLVIESARGVINARQIVRASERVESVSVGYEDLRRDLHLGSSSSELLNHALCEVVLSARTAGITPHGLAGSVADLNPASYRQSAIKSKNLGIEGAMAVHPSQVVILNEVFSPSQIEIERSLQIVRSFDEAIEKGLGVIRVGDLMVDRPVYQAAKQVIEQSTLIKKIDMEKRRRVESFQGNQG